jgi:hypothetical protein
MEIDNAYIIDVMKKTSKTKKFNHSALHDFLTTCSDAKILEHNDYFFKSNIMYSKDLRLWKKSFRVSCIKHKSI